MARAAPRTVPLVVPAMAKWAGPQIMGKIAIPVELTIPTGGPSEVNPVVSLNWCGGGMGNNGYHKACW